MDGFLEKLEVIEYGNLPFAVGTAMTKDPYVSDHYLPHWHEGLEMCYILKGSSSHYIDGVCVKGSSGDLIVTTPKSIHSIVVEDPCFEEDGIRAIVLWIHCDFLEHFFPGYQSVFSQIKKAEFQSR